MSSRCLSVCLSANFKPLQYFWNGWSYTLFKFGKWIDYSKSHRTGEKFPLKGAWSGSRDPFKNFKPPSIFLERMKRHCINLASGSTTVSPTAGVKNFHWKWHGLGHVTFLKILNSIFLDEATLFEFVKCMDQLQQVAPRGDRVKNSPWKGVVWVSFPWFVLPRSLHRWLHETHWLTHTAWIDEKWRWL